MSPFVIFIIVLTIGYILYYAAMITIDLTAKSKSDAQAEVTIATDGLEDDQYDENPRSVTETADGNGFGFSIYEEPVHQHEEIDEAEEQDIEEAVEENETGLSAGTSFDTDESEDAPSSSSDERPSLDDDQEKDAQPERIDEGYETLPSENVDSEQGDEISEVSEDSVSEMSEDAMSHEEEVAEESFDANDAFDQELMTPKYDVAQIVEAAPSEETVCHAVDVNSALMTRPLKGNVQTAFNLSNIIRSNRAGQYDIETHDEYTQF